MRLRPGLVACCLLASASAFAESATVLRCGHLIDPVAGRDIGAHTVVIENGRISRVEKGLEFAQAGAAEIALPEHTCLPGLTDMHVHLSGEQSLPANLRPTQLGQMSDIGLLILGEMLEHLAQDDGLRKRF